MKYLSTKFWINISIFNLLIAAALGVVMRYKIEFEFLWFNQKFLQEAHSHFAFLGWITQTLLVLLIQYLKPWISITRIKIYTLLLSFHLICAYCILFSFALNGYGKSSIVLSGLSIAIFCIFAFLFIIDCRKTEKNNQSIMWFKASIIFNLLSIIGTFYLAYCVASKSIPQYPYLASVYWYLHFQYNGWFFFACVGLFISSIKQAIPSFKVSKSIFWMFALSCIPAYGLSTLWLKLPNWVFGIVVIGSIVQALGWIKLIRDLMQFSLFNKIKISPLSKTLLLAIAFSLTIKFTLQLGSTIPFISKLAFGFRPIVIAYLHLVLLGIISVFLFSHLTLNNYFASNYSAIGLVIFVTGVYINELILCVQGIASIGYHVVPNINYLLFGIALLMLLGLLILFIGQMINASKKSD